jgi:dolichyl-phosphate-mannose-protein mannosyltransferase
VTRRELLDGGLVLLLALALRLWGIGLPAQKWLDENDNTAGAIHYVQSGQFEPDTWEHPPVRNLTEAAFLSALGDNPLGWRLRNVLAGAAAAALTFAFALAIAGRRAALLAGLLVATDPLHVVLSRFTFEEILGGAFAMASVALLVHHRERSGRLVAAALFMGLALATKWYFLPAWALLLALLLREGDAWREPRTAAFLASTWILLPLAVYAAAFLPWFGRGYGLGELVEHTVDAYRHLQAMTEYTVGIIDQRAVFHGHLSAAEWFARPIWTGEGWPTGDGRARFVMYVADLPTWGFTLPAAGAAIVLAARRRAPRVALPALLFLAGWVLFLPVQRPVMLYSAAVLLPFAFTAIAQGVDALAERFGAPIFWGALALAVGWNLYLYPLVSSKEVPLAAYRWILDGAELLLH